MKFENLFALPPLPLEEELITSLAQSGEVRIERIVSTGQATDWYDQAEQEFVALLQGNARLQWEDGSETPLSKGDTMLIPAHKRHRVSYTSNEPACIWLCVFWG